MTRTRTSTPSVSIEEQIRRRTGVVVTYTKTAPIPPARVVLDPTRPWLDRQFTAAFCEVYADGIMIGYVGREQKFDVWGAFGVDGSFLRGTSRRGYAADLLVRQVVTCR